MVKIDYMLILMKCVLVLVVLDLFLVVDWLIQAYQLFVIARQQVSGPGSIYTFWHKKLCMKTLYSSKSLRIFPSDFLGSECPDTPKLFITVVSWN